jgi:glycerol kinase
MAAGNDLHVVPQRLGTQRKIGERGSCCRSRTAALSYGSAVPWWRPNARAVISGIYGGTTPENVARAALEGIAWRVADVVAATRETAPVDALGVDGGLTNEPPVLQLLADSIGAPVEAAGADATVLGAARWAGWAPA